VAGFKVKQGLQAQGFEIIMRGSGLYVSGLGLYASITG
jgi:hypothetical protein